MWLVLYAKVIDDRDRGIVMSGIYFGAVCNTVDEADNVARKCVNVIQGGAIIPKISRIRDTLPNAIEEISGNLNRLVGRMYDNDTRLR